MKIIYKRDDEIAKIRDAGRILALTLQSVSKYIKPGVSTKELEEIAVETMKEYNAHSSCLNYCPQGFLKPYPGAICTSVNEEVVHGIPSSHKKLKEGDIIDIDIVLEYQHYYADSSMTFAVGKVDSKVASLVDTTRRSLLAGILEAQVGNTLIDIARAIEETVKKAGFSIVRDFVGHGVGVAMHEDPPIANFVDGALNVPLMEGMVIAIEPMVNLGKEQVRVLGNKWTVVTVDGKPSAHFENTIAIVNGKPLILTE